jgi:hypothetical protein
MEFSYMISEDEYLRALNPKFKGRVKSVVKTIIFWFLILACLMVIITAIGHLGPQPSLTQRPVIQNTGVSHTVRDLLEVSCLLLLFAAIWVMNSVATPRILRRKYRKDPAMQGQFTVSITRDTISVRNSAGTFDRSGWEPYRSWYETGDLIVLLTRPATSLMISLAGLCESQRDELRGILGEAISKKLETSNTSSCP